MASFMDTELFSDLYYMIFIYFSAVYFLFFKWAVYVARLGKRRCVCTVLVWKPGRKETTWETLDRWEGNINMDVQEVGCEGIGWNDLTQDREKWWDLVNAVMNLRVP